MWVACLDIAHFRRCAPAPIGVVRDTQTNLSVLREALVEVKAAGQLVGQGLFVQVALPLREGDRLVVLFAGLALLAKHACAFSLDKVPLVAIVRGGVSRPLV